MNRPTFESLETRRLLAGFERLLTASGYDSYDELIGTRDGGFVAAGLFQRGVLTDGASEQVASFESDAFVQKLDSQGRAVWSHVFTGVRDIVIETSSDRVDFASRPLRATDPFVHGVSHMPRRPAEQVTGIAEAPDGTIWVSVLYQGTLDPDGAGPLPAFTTPDIDAYNSMFVQLSSSGVPVSAFAIEGRFNVLIHDLQIDALGRIYAGGSFERLTDFNPGRAQFVVSPATGRGDLFVAQFSPRGKLAWLYHAGSDASRLEQINRVYDIAIDSQFNVYAVGTVSRFVDFDPGAGVSAVDAELETDGFVLKLDDAGAFQWVHGQGGEDFDGTRTVAIAPDDSVWTAGLFTNDAMLDPRDPTRVFSATPGERDRPDIVLTRWASDGRVLTLQQIGGRDHELIADLRVDTDGTAVLSGSFLDIVDFAPGRARSVLESPRVEMRDANYGNRGRAYAGFVARYSPRGFLIEADQLTPLLGQDLFVSVAMPTADGILTGGRFRGGFSAPASGVSVSIDPDPRDREDGFLVSLLMPVS